MAGARSPLAASCLHWRAPGSERSITCLFVARSRRRQHLTDHLIVAALGYVRARGGRIVESYPVEPKTGVRSTCYAWTGFVAAYTRAGFVECARRSPTHPIMRYSLDTSTR